MLTRQAHKCVIKFPLDPVPEGPNKEKKFVPGSLLPFCFSQVASRASVYTLPTSQAGRVASHLAFALVRGCP